MRWLITGAHGQLGSDLQRILVDDDVLALGRADLDVADLRGVRYAVADFRPDVVVNSAAYTAVDAAHLMEWAASSVRRDGERTVG